MPIAVLNFTPREICQFLSMLTIIEPSDTPYLSQVILVPKKQIIDHTISDQNHKISPPKPELRYAVDYRKLNAQTKLIGPTTLPFIGSIIDHLRGFSLFNTIDLEGAFMQIRIHPEDKHKTGFWTPLGTMVFNFCAFGLVNMPLFFSQAMTTMLGSLQPAICHAFLDDIIVKSRSHEENLRNLRAVFSKIRDTGMYCKAAKCNFLAEEITYLGYSISAEGIRIARDKFSAVADWAAPTNRKQLRSILGSVSFWKRFVPMYSTITGCLWDLLKKDAKFEWGDKHQSAFEAIKTALTSDPILVYPENSPLAEYTVSVDASKDAIGGVSQTKRFAGKGRDYLLPFPSYN